jgi:hypothetical protein
VVAAAHDGAGLPALYAGWVEAIVGGVLPRETHATCDRCAMCASEGAAGSLAFDAATKCCTYVPVLPNFVTGAVLADPDPGAADGRQSVLARIARRAGVTPLGLTRTRAQTLIHDHSTPAFGRAVALRCPHYLDREGGQCGIWRHRNAICTTWFCKHSRGKRGEDFWKALALMLTEAEKVLLRHCVLELDVGVDALRVLFPHPHDEGQGAALDDLDERVNEARYRAAWGNWYGREEAFYVAAAEIVRPLRWADVTRIGGSELALRARIATGAYVSLVSHALPERAKVGELGIVSMREGLSRVMTYSRFDPLDLPNELLPLLASFDGVKVEEARKQIEEVHGVVLEDELVRKLVDFGVLVAE